MSIDALGMTHVGMKRDHNEDNYLLADSERVYVVADGMGGHAAGEVASKLAVDEVAEFFAMTGRDADATWPFKMQKTLNYDGNRLATAVKLANRQIVESAREDKKRKGMGTTIVAAHFVGSLAFIAHVGDSRGYLWRDGVLTQVTQDHSLLNDYIRAGKLTPQEAESFPQKNVITRALGIDAAVIVDVTRVELVAGDVVLLCTDGLTGMLSDAAIGEVLARNADLERACSQLIDGANANGGTDNVTCILARWSAAPAGA